MARKKMKCKKCKGKMKKGIALENTVVGKPDFIGSNDVCTVSKTGPPKMIKVWKCKKCGYSIK